MTRAKSPATLAFELPGVISAAIQDAMTPAHRNALQARHAAVIGQACMDCSALVIEQLERALVDAGKDRQPELELDNEGGGKKRQPPPAQE